MITTTNYYVEIHEGIEAVLMTGDAAGFAYELPEDDITKVDAFDGEWVLIYGGQVAVNCRNVRII